jgi:hypothetical protein
MPMAAMVIRMIAVTTNSTNVYPLSEFARLRPPAACPNFLFTCTPSNAQPTVTGTVFSMLVVHSVGQQDWCLYI